MSQPDFNGEVQQRSVVEHDKTTLLRALGKYGHALVHTAAIAKSLAEQRGAPFDLEMSVDETTPTSAHKHFLVANELLTRPIPVVSLAPRFEGG